MDLKSGHPVWLAQKRPSFSCPRLRTNASCDVAVIGAGITGALVAHQLINAGLKVIVLDKRAPVTGSTSASTALLSYETDVALADLAGRFGRQSAQRIYQLGRQAIDEIGRIAGELEIDCDFVRRPSLYVASDRKGWALLKREYNARLRAGLPAARLTRAQVQDAFNFDFPGALYSPDCAQVNAVRLAAGVLSHHVHRRRLRVFAHTRVVKLTPAAEHVELRTSSRRLITAKHVVIATGYEAEPFLADGLVALHSTYVIASQPMPQIPLWKDECLMWETARPYFYLRITADRRILIGGEDEPITDPEKRDALLPAKRRRLEGRFKKLFPNIPFKVEFAWAGTFGESADGLPYIGARRNSMRVIYALGYGGNGITFSQIAAKIIADLCRGRRSRDAELFRFDR